MSEWSRDRKPESDEEYVWQLQAERDELRKKLEEAERITKTFAVSVLSRSVESLTTERDELRKSNANLAKSELDLLAEVERLKGINAKHVLNRINIEGENCILRDALKFESAEAMALAMDDQVGEIEDLTKRAEAAEARFGVCQFCGGEAVGNHCLKQHACDVEAAEARVRELEGERETSDAFAERQRLLASRLLSAIQVAVTVYAHELGPQVLAYLEKAIGLSAAGGGQAPAGDDNPRDG